ncbi:hypothetical protein RIF29_09715 [Crotalaria pallida]|uniref:Uncharacterized protein n=1 Tax=Crotalaria pallida TaxID=3830 RepID=A0AAN9FS71_CROPI
MVEARHHYLWLFLRSDLCDSRISPSFSLWRSLLLQNRTKPPPWSKRTTSSFISPTCLQFVNRPPLPCTVSIARSNRIVAGRKPSSLTVPPRCKQFSRRLSSLLSYDAK